MPAVDDHADDVLIVAESSLPHYIDGNTPGWLWSGASRASPSFRP